MFLGELLTTFVLLRRDSFLVVFFDKTLLFLLKKDTFALEFNIKGKYVPLFTNCILIKNNSNI